VDLRAVDQDSALVGPVQLGEILINVLIAGAVLPAQQRVHIAEAQLEDTSSRARTPGNAFRMF